MILYPNDTHLYDKWHPQFTDRPLVFLDVDGVINWTAAPKNDPDLYDIIEVPVMGGWPIILPFWTRELVHYLVDNAEVVWLTAWKELANQGLTDVLSIPKLPTLTDDKGSVRRDVDWKVAAMQPIAHQAHKLNGREVIWIEDFGFNSSKTIERIWAKRTYEGIPEFVHTIDTLPFGALHWDHLTGTPIEAGIKRYG